MFYNISRDCFEWLVICRLQDNFNKKNKKMKEFKQYRRKSVSEMRPYIKGENMDGISVSDADIMKDSPKVGDMIARNPKNHNDQWLVAKAYFEDNLEEIK